MILQRSIVVSALLSLVLLGTVPPADAGPQPVVTRVTASPQSDVLFIDGQSFDPSWTFVTFGGQLLQVLGATPIQIIVHLPGGVAPGAYLLEVQSGKGSKSVTFEITFGAVGPEGPSGPR